MQQRSATAGEALANLDENCLEPHPDKPNRLCNRPPFHHGDHICRQYTGTNQKEIARWPQRQRLICDSCGEQGVPMPDDFMSLGCQLPNCLLCGAEQREMDELRVGWDESD